MKLSIMHAFQNSRKHNKIRLFVDMTQLKLGSQYRTLHYANIMLPFVPAVIDYFQNMTKG